MKTCAHCGTELWQHPADAGGSKAGALHCDGCGCCFKPDGKTQREGIPLCAGAQMQAEAAEGDKGSAATASRQTSR